MEQEIFCIPLRSTLKNSRIHPRDPPTTRKGLRPLQPQKEERTACLPPTFLASCAEPPARSRPPPQRPPGTIVVDLAAGLRLSSVRTEGRLFSGRLVLLKPRPRSRRAARAGIASPAIQPTPPATTRGAAPCIPECLGALPPSPPAKELRPSALPFLRGLCPHTPALAAGQEGRGLPSAGIAFGARATCQGRAACGGRWREP